MTGELHEDNILTVSEVAQIMKVTKVTVYSWIRTGILTSFRIGRNTIRIRRSALQKMTEKNVVVTPEVPKPENSERSR